jgi:hypothetical protein
MLGLLRIAQNLSRKKSLKIKHLRDYERPVTANTGRQASIGATVEFSGRAVAGFARG